MAKIKYLNRRKKVFWHVSLIFSALIILSAVLAWSLFYFDKFKVKEIVVEGNSTLSADSLAREIRSVLTARIFGILPQDSIFFVPQDEIKSRLLAQFKKLESIELQKNLPSTVTIKVTEREPVAILCPKKCFFVDDSAFIFEESAVFSSGVFLKFFDERQNKPAMGEFLLDRNVFEALLVFKKRIEEYYPVEEIRLKNEGIYEIYTKDGWYLLLDEEGDWNLTYVNFETFLNEVEVFKGQDKNLEYIDLRFGNKIFYK